MKRIFVLLMSLFVTTAAHALEMGDDGLYQEPWIRETFMDLREDLAEANDLGLRMVVMVEQRGCIYCHKMHEDVYSDPELSAFIEDNFFVVRINLHGSTEVVDFDGEVMEERELARKWGLLFTPMVLFMPQDVAEDMSGPQAAVAIMPGAFAKGTTTDMYTWVLEERYLTADEEDFQRYHARRIQERNNGSFD